jgi:hypothetical protein
MNGTVIARAYKSVKARNAKSAAKPRKTFCPLNRNGFFAIKQVDRVKYSPEDKPTDGGCVTLLPESQSGFQIIENILCRKQCAALLESLSSANVGRGRAGARHLMSHPQVAQVANDRCLLEIATALLHQEAVPFRATLFNKSPAANWLVVWHQDTALPLRRRFEADGWGPWSQKAGVNYAHAPGWALSRVVALRIHLDASTTTNGPLRVVPDSHNAGVLTDEEIGIMVKERGFTECIVAQGGILVMRPLLIHASSKVTADTPRRVLHIEYADSLSLAEKIDLAIA